MAYGGADGARAAVAEALALAGRDELPTSGSELVAFVRAHLLASLTEQVGPRLTMALLDDLAGQLDPSGIPPPPDSQAPPSSVPRPVARIAMHPGSAPRVRGLQLGVLLVDADRVGRTTLARSLLRAQSNVTLVDTLADLVAVINADEVVDAVLLDISHPAAQAIVELLVRSRPEAAVVARGGDPVRTRAFLTQLGVTKLDVRSREAPAEELIDALKRVTAR
jgi:CheY-like chemotaxis protein